MFYLRVAQEIHFPGFAHDIYFFLALSFHYFPEAWLGWKWGKWRGMCCRTTRTQVYFSLAARLMESQSASLWIMQLKTRPACPEGGLAQKRASGALVCLLLSYWNYHQERRRHCPVTNTPNLRIITLGLVFVWPKWSCLLIPSWNLAYFILSRWCNVAHIYTWPSMMK